MFTAFLFSDFCLFRSFQTNDVDEFGDSWKLGTQCVDDIPTPLDPCNNTDYSQQALELCNIIIQEPGEINYYLVRGLINFL